MARTNRDTRPRLERGSLVLWIAGILALGAVGLHLTADLGVVACVALFVAAQSLVTFVLFWIDKRRSGKQGRRRVSERVLLGSAALGGAPGAVLGMSVLRHKTKHTRFRILMPLLAILHAGLVGWLIVSG